VSWGKVTSGTPLALWFETVFGHELVQPPLQSAFGVSKFWVRKQFFYGCAVQSCRNNTKQIGELLIWNLKWHDFWPLWHELNHPRQIHDLLWHDYPYHARKIKTILIIMPHQDYFGLLSEDVVTWPIGRMWIGQDTENFGGLPFFSMTV
jgi:hypothetical protein